MKLTKICLCSLIIAQLSTFVFSWQFVYSNPKLLHHCSDDILINPVTSHDSVLVYHYKHVCITVHLFIFLFYKVMFEDACYRSDITLTDKEINERLDYIMEHGLEMYFHVRLNHK